MGMSDVCGLVGIEAVSVPFSRSMSEANAQTQSNVRNMLDVHI